MIKFAAVLFLFSVAWLIVTLFRRISTKTRAKANSQLKWVACSFVVSIIVAAAFGEDTPATATTPIQTTTPEATTVVTAPAAPEVAKKPTDVCQDRAFLRTAFEMSKKAVTRKLKAPSTATFPSGLAEGVKVARSGECKFIVSAYVDSQNSYGAMLRSQYAVQLSYSPEKKSWNIDEFAMK